LRRGGVARAPARRWWWAAIRSWMIVAVPHSTTKITPKIAVGSWERAGSAEPVRARHSVSVPVVSRQQ